MIPIIDAEEYKVRVKDKACLIVGDIILDKYISGTVNRISPEAPIPILNVNSKRYILGGAANVAGNIMGLCVKTYLCGVVGRDEAGDICLEELSDNNIDYIGIRINGRPTTMKTRVVGMNQQLVRIDEEETTFLTAEEELELFNRVESVIKKVSVIVLSDYNKGVLTNDFCRRIINLARENKIRVIVDPKKDDWSIYEGAYLITPNFKEFCVAIKGEIINDESAIAANSGKIMNKFGLEHLLVTRSQFGMTLISGSNISTYRAIQHEVYDVSGAGDTVIATIAAFLSAGYSLDEAVIISNYSAGLAVSKPGTYVARLKEVIDYINDNGIWYEEKIMDIKKLVTKIGAWKENNERIVFTNGCFDILHVGHINYLNKARALGSKMIIAINSDSSVQRLKGPNRPVNNERARTLVIAALQCVDAVVVFNEDTPRELVKMIRPDFLVKGGDYRPEDVVGREFADKVVIVPLEEGYSTTNLIKKINHKNK